MKSPEAQIMTFMLEISSLFVLHESRHRIFVFYNWYCIDHPYGLGMSNHTHSRFSSGVHAVLTFSPRLKLDKYWMDYGIRTVGEPMWIAR